MNITFISTVPSLAIGSLSWGNIGASVTVDTNDLTAYERVNLEMQYSKGNLISNPRLINDSISGTEDNASQTAKGGNVRASVDQNGLVTLRAPGVTSIQTGLSPAVRRPSLQSSFTQAMASAGSLLKRKFVFGSSAQGDSSTIAIKNVGDLSTYFNAFEDFTGQTTINGEMQRYQPFNATNHQFVADKLNLVGVNDTPVSSIVGVGNATGYTPNGTADIPIASIGLASTSGIEVGRLVAMQYRGIGYVSAVTANTSIRITALSGTATGILYNNLIVFPNAYTATSTAAHTAGTNTLVFGTNLPAGVTVGMQVSTYNNPNTIARDADYRIQAIDAATGTLTLNRSTTWGNQASGARFIFTPAITSGQIWTKDWFDISSPQSFFAVEMDADILVDAAIFNPSGINTISAYNAAPADVPWGAWPALWAYSADDGTGLSPNTSELDMLELWWSTTSGSRALLGNNLGGSGQANLYMKTDSGWSTFSGLNNHPNDGVGFQRRVKIQFIYTMSGTFRYVDGVLVKADRYEWTSARAAQIGINLVVGTLAQSYAANLSFPFRSENFAGMKFGIRSLSVWHKP